MFTVSRSAKEWSNAQNALAYLNVADTLPHRSEGESVLLDHIPQNARRILDLGTGDGRLIRLIKSIRPEIEAVALEYLLQCSNLLASILLMIQQLKL